MKFIIKDDNGDVLLKEELEVSGKFDNKNMVEIRKRLREVVSDFIDNPRSSKQKKVGSSFGSSSKQVNLQYQYEDHDIQAILSSRVEELYATTPPLKLVYVLAAVDNIVDGQLTQRLQQDIESYTHDDKTRIVLIPCNLGNFHWVGILVEFKYNGEIERAIYIDSLTDHNKPTKNLNEQLQSVYSSCNLKVCNLKVYKLLQQQDTTSCGAYTIENLLLAIQHKKANKLIEAKEIRLQHLECLQKYNLEFYKNFYIRQRYNRPTTCTIKDQLEYLNEEVHFSTHEINRILNVKKCLAQMSKEVKKLLLEAFRQKDQKEEVKTHLERIRMTLQDCINKKMIPKDQQLLQEIIKLLFSTKVVADLNNVDFRLEYKEILAINNGKKLILQQINKIQEEVIAQIKADEDFASKLQRQEYNKARTEKLSFVRQKSDDTMRSGSSDGVRRELFIGSPLLFSTPARNTSLEVYSGASSLPITHAATAKQILLSYTINDGKISLIINSSQRSDTILSGSQGDHVTAYTTLLQMVCSIIDGEDLYDAPKMLHEVVKCFIGNLEQLQNINKLFADKQQQIEKKFFPREMRKPLTYNLRIISQHSKSIVNAIADKKLKSALEFFINQNKPQELNIDFLRDTIKNSNCLFFAQFLVEVGNQLLVGYNKEDTAALPKLNIDQNVAEGNRVKEAMKELRLLNKLIEFKHMLLILDRYDHNQRQILIEEFKNSYKSIITTSNPKIKNPTTIDAQYNKFLNSLFHLELQNNDIIQVINKLNFNKIKFESVGKLFNDLFDFKQSSIRKPKPGESIKTVTVIDNQIVFPNPEEVLYQVTARHIKFMFLAFKNLRSLDEKGRQGIIKGFLKYVIGNAIGKNDNSQGWSNYMVTDDQMQTVNLDVHLIYNEIEGELAQFFGVLVTGKKQDPNRPKKRGQ